jgi:hypothetical protein
MPDIYRPTIQTVETTMKVTKKIINPNDLIDIFIQEAKHCVIGNTQTKMVEAAMATFQGSHKGMKKNGKGKQKGKSGITCDNCHKPGHTKDNCFHPGGGKEGQALSHWNLGKKKKEPANVAKVDDEKDFFAFTCSSDFKAISANPKHDVSQMDTIIDSSVSHHFCMDRSRFCDYKSIDCVIKTADGRTFKGLGMGNV